jgi:RNA polymerase sigma-70 factor (ECF subfamily)
VKSEWQHFYRFALSLTADEADAYDLVHMVVVSLLEKGVDIHKTSRSYMFTCLRNRFIDTWRRGKKIDFESYTDEDEKLSTVTPISFEDVLINKAEVSHLLQGMKPQERELLYLNVVEEYSVAEIAKTLGSPRGTILSRLHRIKQRLKNRLARKEG